jgi:Zn-dependent protease
VIRFRFAGVPVTIHLSHLLISGLIAWSFVGWKLGATSWPREILANTDHPAHDRTAVLVWLGWTSLVTLSVLVHELGHAVATRIFGGKPQIHLIGLGGRTMVEGVEHMDWWQEVLITLAGPAAGLALGVFAGGVAWAGGASLPDAVRYFGTGLFFANLSWTILNLLPITGLDGGVITTLVLTRAFGRAGFLLAQVLAIALAGVVMVWAFATAQPLLAMLVGFMLLRTFGNISAYQRGELPAGHAAHPLTAVVERAEALYRERKLTEAQVIAQGVVESAQTPSLLRSRAHVLLGWIALKEGNGRRALDHFSQVQGLEVPPHALAAGFSLVGDEHRAIPLWERAAKTASDDLLLHEYAGALIRGGREAEARTIPHVQMARAFSAAERVHYVRKEYEQAAKAAEAAFHEAPQPALAYTAACAWALANKPDDAMRLLALAAQAGFRDAAEARADPDLRSLRGRPEFEGWLQSLAA